MKAKRGGGGGHHGGSWKVALADFAIAMMALFLLLWVLNATDDDAKSAIAAYFEDPGAFRHQSSLSPIDFGGQDSLVEIPNPGPTMRGREGPEIMSDGNAETLNEDPDFRDLMDELQRLIGGDDSAGEYEDFIYLEQLQEGVRIVILDNDKRNMFARGSSRINPFFQDLLLELAPIINKIDQRVMISGHTDNSGFQRRDYGNWELSAARAQVARRTLIFGGYDENKVLMVLGMADRVPRDPEHPESSANRRIEIMVLAEYMERQVERMFAPVEDEDHQNHPGHRLEMHDAFERAAKNQLDVLD
ncbi:OmpA family protein [Endozoicomonas ascidiicola]|uniref:OmpA family protein n=1 Tax=Endozoicomonas ascidiicola TaxID=1698521 RepID=UPI00082DFA08|nr:flagellar motor protein MotB [Endozoicomonas ascidiicola]